MSTTFDTRLRWFGPLVLFVFGTFFFRLTVYLTSTPKELLQFIMVALTYGYIGWNVARWVVLRMQQRYPGLARTRQRLLLLLGVGLILANINSMLRVFTHQLLNNGIFASPELVDYVYTTGIQVFYVFVYIGIYEGLYLVLQWKQTYQEKEVLVKAQWQSQFESLKNQVNPHFLFNSLNSLSSLIADEPQQAEQFVDEMARVYRYLLQTNQGQLTSLETELSFISSYTHLLKTRYGNGISVEIDVHPSGNSCYLPPLTLQMLIENAVKHNSIQHNKPLLIEIRTTADNRLTVRNNIQKRTNRVASNQVGLSNIAAKYQMLSRQNVVVQDNGMHFTVELPLLRSPQLADVS